MTAAEAYDAAVAYAQKAAREAASDQPDWAAVVSLSQLSTAYASLAQAAAVVAPRPDSGTYGIPHPATIPDPWGTP